LLSRELLKENSMSAFDTCTEKDPENIMIYLNGRQNLSFHCEQCGCNVFHHPETEPRNWPSDPVEDVSDKYICNSCGIQYIGEG
jgi:hypothetical protein